MHVTCVDDTYVVNVCIMFTIIGKVEEGHLSWWFYFEVISITQVYDMIILNLKSKSNPLTGYVVIYLFILTWN